MKVRAQAKYVRQSPYKVRRVLDLVRGLPVQEAEDVLRLTQRGATEPITKVLKSAVANAEHNHALDAGTGHVLADAQPASASAPATSRSWCQT
jgi:large subunit ribosomal protein L22